jgi:hypothetical protein
MGSISCLVRMARQGFFAVRPAATGEVGVGLLIGNKLFGLLGINNTYLMHV